MKFKIGDKITIKPEFHSGYLKTYITVVAININEYVVSTGISTRSFKFPDLDNYCMKVQEPNDALKEIL